MKNLFLYLNHLFPALDHNAHLVLKLVPYLNCSSHAIALSTSEDNTALPETIKNTPVYFIKTHKFLDKILRCSLSFVLGQERASIWLNLVKTYIQSLPFRIKNNPHAVLSTFQRPYPPMMSAMAGKSPVKALYIMDPSAAMWRPGLSSANESKWFLSALKRHDVVFTTKFIHETMLSRGYGKYIKKIVDVSFPMVTGFPYQSNKPCDDKITLLFAGSLYSDIRSPEYFLKVISKLDSRFRVLFIGHSCHTDKRIAALATKAELIARPAIPYDQILQEMANADILINIGNSIPVHLPSKTLEYINTGKPFVNFYKFDECPTLSFAKRYPLCLNLSEQNDDIDAVAKQFIDFCVQSKGKQLEREFIESEFAEATPQYIARVISEELFGNEK